LREVLEVLDEMCVALGRLHITGGGARSPLWRQIVADVLNRPLSFAESDSCLGAAMLAAAGAGLHPDVSTACAAMTNPAEEIRPQPAAAEAYAGLYAEFCRQRDALFGPG
jgi:xylulokinase